MASSADVQVVPAPGVEAKQPAVAEAACCDGGSGSTGTVKEESVTMMTVLHKKHEGTAPEPGFHEDAVAPELHHLQYDDDKEALEPSDFNDDAAVPEPGLQDDDDAAAPAEQAAHASTSEEEPKEEAPKQPAVAEDKDEAEHNNMAPAVDEDDDHHQDSTRERLKRHRQEVAGRVWVPDMWGQEKMLKDWVDCAVFDRPLVPAGLLTARRALVAESCTRRPDRTTSTTTTVSSVAAGSSPLRLQNGCS